MHDLTNPSIFFSQSPLKAFDKIPATVEMPWNDQREHLEHEVFSQYRPLPRLPLVNMNCVFENTILLVLCLCGEITHQR